MKHAVALRPARRLQRRVHHDHLHDDRRAGCQRRRAGPHRARRHRPGPGRARPHRRRPDLPGHPRRPTHPPPAHRRPAGRERPFAKAKPVAAYGTTHRIFTEGQRLAMIARDKGCSFPGCTVGPAWCEANHVTEWQYGKRTSIDDGALLCGFHHREFEKLGWHAHDQRHPALRAAVMARPRPHPTAQHRSRHLPGGIAHRTSVPHRPRCTGRGRAMSPTGHDEARTVWPSGLRRADLRSVVLERVLLLLERVGLLLVRLRLGAGLGLVVSASPLVCWASPSAWSSSLSVSVADLLLDRALDLLADTHQCTASFVFWRAFCAGSAAAALAWCAWPRPRP